MDLSAFLAENAIPPEEEAAFVVSKRFLSDETDKKGNRKPLQWKLKAITGAEDESLRKSCVKRVPVPGRRNQYQQETDYNLYLGKLAVACTVYPNLNDKALQDSYKVMGAENLLKTMLTSGEYAEYLQKVQEVCGFDAEKGAVTAEVVKDALLGAADETNAAFESMPMTWGQIWTSMQNKALSIFSPILQRINDIANTDKFSAVTNGLLDGLAAAAKAGTVTLDVLLSITSAFIDNWGIIQPLIFGIAAAMLLYNGYLLTNNALTAISNIQKGIAAVQAYKAAAANAALSASEQAAAMSTASATAAQYGFNAALLSCPLTWVIVGIIAVVAAIYLIVAAINNMTGSAISATGIICGIFAVAASLILNTGIGVYNSFLAIIGTFVNFFLGIIEWVLNAANGGFDSFGGAVANLIGQIISWFLSLGQVVTTIIDAIFGTSWTAGLEDLKSSVTQWGKNDTAITLDRGDYSGIQRIQYSDAWDAGYSFGQGVDSKVSGLFDGFSMDSMGAFDFGNTLERIEQNSGFTAANTAASSKKLDITSEELKYLRDIAEREAINRFTTAEVRIEQTNHNSISKDVDVDGIMDYWADWFAEKLDAGLMGLPIPAAITKAIDILKQRAETPEKGKD